MKYWLMKSEPDVYGIDDLENEGSCHWEGVRNYQARNIMRDEMRVGDRVLFYHSNAKPSGVAGLARVAKRAYPDFTAWDPKHKYFDAKTDKDNPRWMMVDVRFEEKFADVIALAELKEAPGLEDMMVTKRGMRLSIQPVTQKEYRAVVRLGRAKAKAVAKTKTTVTKKPKAAKAKAKPKTKAKAKAKAPRKRA